MTHRPPRLAENSAEASGSFAPNLPFARTLAVGSARALACSWLLVAAACIGQADDEPDLSSADQALTLASGVTPITPITPVTPPITTPIVTPILPIRWDFEDGTLQGWVHEDVSALARLNAAFYNQPTFGDNVSAQRALDLTSMVVPPDPCAGLVLDARLSCDNDPLNTFPYLSNLARDLTNLRSGLDSVGGDYWHAPFPIGKHGMYWIGSAEDRQSRLINPSTVPVTRWPIPHEWGGVQGDGKTGRIFSPEFAVNHKVFHLLVGGGCSDQVGVYLQTQQWVLPPGIIKGPSVPIGGGASLGGGSSGSARLEWRTALDAKGKPIAARGQCAENMVRTIFDISNLVGTTKARIMIEDQASTGPYGHINVDDINITNDWPMPSSRSRDPVWGVADLHAHLMNEKAYTAFAEDGTSPEAKLLWGSANGPLSGMARCNDTHTTSYDEAFGSTYTLCRDLCINLLEGAGTKPEGGGVFDGMLHDTDGGYPYFHAWPMFYSAAHQQMHWSWVKRAFDGGLRMMIATVGNSEILSFSLTKEKTRKFTSDQDALALQIPAIKAFASANSTWTEVAYTPQDARRIANSGKLALIIGVELDHVMDSCSADVTKLDHHSASEDSHPDVWASAKGYDLDWVSGIGGAAQFLGGDTRVMNYRGHPRTCTPAQIDARLSALYEQGVRHVIPMHFSDNMLGGYAINSDMFIASAVFGNPDASPPALGTAAEAAGIDYKLPGIQAPVWAKLDPTFIASGSLVEPGIARTILDFFTGDCIEDEGWRIVAGILTLGGSEAGCGVRTLTSATFDSFRSTMPYEGLTDSPLMISYNVPGSSATLPGHVNSRGLQPDGELFLASMMRRGMLVDLQHASEKAKNRMLDVLGTYPSMASHGGIQTGTTRANENVLSNQQVLRIYEPPSGFAGGLVGLGAQSSRGVARALGLLADNDAGPSVLDHETQVQTRGAALGTDLNGMDWHEAPRFGRWAFPQETAQERHDRVIAPSTGILRDGGVGPMVNYASYPSSTNPYASTAPDCAGCAWPGTRATNTPLNPYQVSTPAGITRTFDINFDGLAHFGMIPDFLEEVSLATSDERMGMMFRSVESVVSMWEEACYQAYHQSSPAANITRGCGSRSNYE